MKNGGWIMTQMHSHTLNRSHNFIVSSQSPFQKKPTPSLFFFFGNPLQIATNLARTCKVSNDLVFCQLPLHMLPTIPYFLHFLL